MSDKNESHITKQKSRQTLLVLQLGYDVLWTDVDIFWKQDPRRDVLTADDGLEGVNVVLENLAAQRAATSMRQFYFVQ